MMTELACALGELPPPELGAAFLAQADNAISVAAEAIQTRRAVLVDDFTFFSLGQGLSSPADALPGVFATAIRSGPRSGSFRHRIEPALATHRSRGLRSLGADARWGVMRRAPHLAAFAGRTPAASRRPRPLASCPPPSRSGARRRHGSCGWLQNSPTGHAAGSSSARFGRAGSRV
jgi:hypothetical protein